MSHDATTTPYGSAPWGPAPAGNHAPSAATGPAPFAGWFRRVGANLLDTVVDLAPYAIGGGVALATAAPTVDALGRQTVQPSLPGLLALLVGFLVSLGVTIWNRYLRQGRTGQSVGKRALGIRLVSARTGGPVGAGLAFGRDIAHVLDGVLYLGYLWPLWDPMKQTFADKIIGSVVVREH